MSASLSSRNAPAVRSVRNSTWKRTRIIAASTTEASKANQNLLLTFSCNAGQLQPGEFWGHLGEGEAETIKGEENYKKYPERSNRDCYEEWKNSSGCMCINTNYQLRYPLCPQSYFASKVVDSPEAIDRGVCLSTAIAEPFSPPQPMTIVHSVLHIRG